MARDESSGEEGWYPVARVFITPGKELLELAFEGEGGSVETLRVTGEHPLWSLDDDGWDHAAGLELGEVVDTQAGPMRLVGMARIVERATVFNLEVEGAHTYFVGEAGVWVHNRCLTLADVGWEGAVGLELQGTFNVRRGVATARFEYIGGKIPRDKVLGTIERLKATARAEGATQLRIETTEIIEMKGTLRRWLESRGFQRRTNGTYFREIEL
ncbi:MAG: hypothetical protein HC927_02005 [Deltaproteobacteria bacterium]|nr:hypothetical protein [Deltaproteobacteria bacterium]